MKYRTIGSDPGTRREVSVLALGAMLFGSRTDEKTSFAVLDRYVEAGGNFIDTSDNYAFWIDGGQGGQSEELLGRWRRSRGIGNEIVIATKLGARPLAPGTSYVDNAEGLSAKVIRESAERSRERLGVERLDLLYAHIEDRTVSARETVEGFAELVAEGTVGLLGASNHAVWRVERARALAAAAGLPGYEVLQYHHSYLRPRTDVPNDLWADGTLGATTAELLSYLEAEPALTLVAYSPLLTGGYVRPDKLQPDYDHPGTPARTKVLGEVARETGATVNQVVLAWQLGGRFPIVPLAGVSSVAQLEENLGAVELELTEEQRVRLDAAH
ncbi:aldo/keto reductase [Streptomyces europaeiscabiei]|uniref:aldo/keto reductase n=1 Tax=Streptomyces europaeiscabiei TaxID=146819 RepID=UPI0029A3D486|nr:aldo/keto reductase [Streptomyces europaeiscabiei]MDX3586729.1 aldo/keto reductase [Streptomyces europaeiscabiei]WUD36840.1 aldo/keto reductase [Streptomyces europaeiscabiei]